MRRRAEKRLSASRVHDVHVIISGALALDPGTVAHLETHRSRCETVAAQLELTLTPDASVVPGR